MNVAVFFGGESCEHDVSIITGVQLTNKTNVYLYNIIPIYIDKKGMWWTGEGLKDLDNYPSNMGKLKNVAMIPNDNSLYIKLGKKLKKYLTIDVAIIAMHGNKGEDGVIASLLELSNIPYSSCSALSSAVAMDKVVFKSVLKGLCVNCVESVSVFKRDYEDSKESAIDKIKSLGFPIIIKPSRLGSSIGIEVCKNISDLEKCLNNAFCYDSRLLIEKFVDIKKEVNIALFRNKNEIEFSNTEEPKYNHEILDFDEKYKNGNGMDSIKRIMPANINDEQLKYIHSSSRLVYDYLDMFGVVRFDYIIDKEDNVYLNEVNAIPGSMANYLFDKKYAKLIDEIILNALIRNEKNKEFVNYYNSNIIFKGISGLKK